MKSKILMMSGVCVILATGVGIVGTIVSESAKISGKYGPVAGILVLASMGLFMVGLASPKE